MVDAAAAAQELLARRKARESFTHYCAYRLPEDMHMAPHHVMLCKALDEIEKGENDRLIVMMPPGSAKSTYGSIYFPEYFAGRNPQLSIMAASHTAELWTTSHSRIYSTSHSQPTAQPLAAGRRTKAVSTPLWVWVAPSLVDAVT